MKPLPVSRKKIVSIVLLTALLAVLLCGCLPTRSGAGGAPAGFFTGVWHGWIAPVSLIFSLFGKASLYEANNTGFWYDLGFYMAIISGFGCLSLSRRKRRHRED